MKTKTINLYEFDELNEAGKRNALSNLWDCNVDFNDWFECVYDSASSVAVKITSFDLNRHELGMKLMDESETAKKVQIEYLSTSSIHKLGLKYEEDRDKLVTKYSTAPNRDVVDEDKEYEFDLELDELNDEFNSDIREEFLSQLQKEWDFQTSEKQIIDTIKINNWTFTAEGKLQN